MTVFDEHLASAFPPAFAAFGRTLLLPSPGAVPLSELLLPETLAEVIHGFAAPFPGGDRRAVLSLWSQHYLLALVPAATTAALVSGWDPCLELAQAGAVLAPQGTVAAFCLPDKGRPAACACPATRLTPLLRSHLEPLSRVLAASGLPSRVFWGNVAAILAWTLGVTLAPVDRVGLVRGAIKAAGWIDSGDNPLWPGACAAARGGCRATCCLRYLLPGVAGCPDCPRAKCRAPHNPA